MHLTMSSIALRTLGGAPSESSSVIRARVEAARARQADRHRGETTVNATVSGRVLLRQLGPDARALLDTAAESLSLSARAYHRVVRVSRTIADLAGVDQIDATHVAEALRYRP